MVMSRCRKQVSSSTRSVQRCRNSTRVDEGFTSMWLTQWIAFFIDSRGSKAASRA